MWETGYVEIENPGFAPCVHGHTLLFAVGFSICFALTFFFLTRMHKLIVAFFMVLCALEIQISWINCICVCNLVSIGVLCYILVYPGNWNRTIFITSSYSVQKRLSISGMKLYFCKTCVEASQGALPKVGLKRARAAFWSGSWWFGGFLDTFLNFSVTTKCYTAFRRAGGPLAVGVGGNLLGKGRSPVCSFPSSLWQPEGHWCFAVLCFQNLISFPICPLIRGLSLAL